MSYEDYVQSKKIAESSFESIVMGLMRNADTFLLDYLKLQYPDIWNELYARYNAPGGKLKGRA